MDIRIGKFYQGLNITFSIEHIRFTALNMAFECFQRSIPSHSHSSNSFEIHYIPYGKGTLTMDDQTYNVEPNTLYITGPHVEHSQFPDPGDPMSEYCVYLKLEDKHTGNRKGNFISLFHHTLSWYGQDRQNIHSIMKSLFDELEHQNTGYMLMAEAYLKELILSVVRNYEITNGSGTIQSLHSVKPVLNPEESNYLIIEECFLYEYRDLTLEKLAERLGLGIRQTERLLMKCYTKNFQQMKKEAKMSAACVLLKEKSKTITEISELLGYSSVEHFSHSFRQHYGMAPSHYRKNIRALQYVHKSPNTVHNSDTTFT